MVQARIQLKLHPLKTKVKMHDFTPIQVIGEGSFGQVVLARQKVFGNVKDYSPQIQSNNNSLFAIKSINPAA